MFRRVTDNEMVSLGTRHAIVVRFVRDGSPADEADLLPGDIILKVNDLPFDGDALRNAEKGPQPFVLHIIRAGNPRDISVSVPPDWRPN